MSKREFLIKRIQPKEGKKRGIKTGLLLVPVIFVLELIFSRTSLGQYLVFLMIYRISPFATILMEAILFTIPMIVLGYLFEKENAKYREYISIIENHRVLSMDEIATVMSVTYEQAEKDISKMIEKGFFGNAHIDKLKRKIVLPNLYVDMETEVVEKNVSCPACGASVKVSSLGDNTCEYCGTALEIEFD